MVVLKELFFYHLLLWAVCGGHERTDFLHLSNLGVCGGHERADFWPVC